ncbi:HAD-IA family hydrolase [Kineococcus gynurae]|uniref:HAD-IA family hydrolase n=1 Tax=Kineococcus gynurae TaxID=452979 RepID=A0ABV5LVI0_9ACTN
MPLPDRAFAAVLFDMDGTLIDSTAAIARSWTTFAVEQGITREVFAQAHGHGRPAREIVRDLLVAQAAATGAGVDDAAVAAGFRRITDLEVADVDDIVRLPGVAEALSVLPAPRWAIVTSCDDDLAAARMRAAGLPAPQVLVTADSVHRGKPDPECFRLGAEGLGLDPADCLVVEDAPAGLTAGRAAGAATLAVRTTHPEGPLDADEVVTTLADVRFRVEPDGVRVEVLRTAR